MKEIVKIRSSNKEMHENISKKSKKKDFFKAETVQKCLKNAFLGGKSLKFSGGGPPDPRSLAGFACFCAGWHKFLRRTLESLTEESKDEPHYSKVTQLPNKDVFYALARYLEREDPTRWAKHASGKYPCQLSVENIFA